MLALGVSGGSYNLSSLSKREDLNLHLPVYKTGALFWATSAGSFQGFILYSSCNGGQN